MTEGLQEKFSRAAKEGKLGHVLTSEDVDEIRIAYYTGTKTTKEIAKRYGISDPMVSYIAKWKSWIHTAHTNPEVEAQYLDFLINGSVRLGRAELQDDGRPVISHPKIREIRAACDAPDYKRIKVVRRFGVSKSTVDRIKKRAGIYSVEKVPAIAPTRENVVDPRIQMAAERDAAGQAEKEKGEKVEGVTKKGGKKKRKVE